MYKLLPILLFAYGLAITTEDIYDNSCVYEVDCAGVCGGEALLDNCEVCDADTTNDCIQDCLGVWGGDAAVDACNVCGGDDST